MKIIKGNMIKKLTIILSVLTAIYSQLAFSTEWDLQLYENKSPSELIELSWFSQSTQEKVFLRSYIASNYSETQEGLFSRAWMASRDGNSELSKKLYLQCIASFPDNRYCVANGASHSDNKVALLEKHIKKHQYFSSIVRNYLIYVLAENKNQSIDSIVRNALSIMDDNPAIHVWAAHQYVSKNQISLADKSFTRALEFDNADFGHFKDASNFRHKHLATSTKEKVSAVVNTMSEYINNRNISAFSESYARAYIGDVVADIANNIHYSISFWVDSWNLHPSYKVAKKLLEAVKYRNKVQDSIDEMPNLLNAIPSLSIVLASDYLLYNKEKEAKKIYTNAFSNNFGAQDADTLLNAIIKSNVRYFSDYNWVDGLIERYKKQFPNNKEEVASLNYNNSYYARDYGKALAALKKNESLLSNPNKSFFEARYIELEGFIAAEQKVKDFYKNNPFLDYWQESFGKSLSVQLEFSTNSATISRQYFSELNKMANVLKHQGAKNYLFQLEGHTDSQGSSELNKSLSERRAQAVKNYFVEKHQIDSERLIVKGYGEEFPITSNETAQGRKKNRRVDLLPMGRVDKVSLLSPSSLNNRGQFQLSPDGHTMAISSSPVELWDIRSQTKIRDLGRSSSKREFSPDGRYLVVSSSWRRDDGSISFQAIIYDVKTGLVYDRLLSEDKLKYFAWSATSEKLAYTTDWGVLNLYDMKEKKVVKQAALSKNAKVPKGLQWDHQLNRIYTAESVVDYIRVWDGDTLAHITDWRGVSWVHGMKLSADHQYLIANDNRRFLSVFETTTGNKKQFKVDAWGGNVFPHPTKPWVLLSDSAKPFNQSVYHYKTKEKIAGWQDSIPHIYEFSNDGKILYQANDDHILVRDGISFIEKSKIQSDINRAKELQYLPSANEFIVSTEQSTQVWDIDKAKRVHEWPLPLNLIEYKNHYGISKQNRNLYRLDLDLYQLNKQMKFTIKPDFSTQSENLLLIAENGYDNDVWNLNAETKLEGKLALIDLKSNSEINKTTVDFVTGSTKYNDIYQAGFNAIAVDKKLGLIAYVTYWQDGFGQNRKISKQVTVLNAKTMAVEYVIKRNRGIKDVQFNNGQLELFESTRPLIFNAKNGVFIKQDWDRNKNHNVIGTLDGKDVTTNKETYISVNETNRITFNDNLVDAVVVEERGLILALLTNGKVEVYRISDQSKLLTLLAREKDEWLAYTPDGFYHGSLKGAEDSLWSFGDLALPFETFADKFYNPRIIEQQLQAVSESNESLLSQLQEESLSNVNTAVFSLPYKVIIQHKPAKETKSSNAALTLVLAKMSESADSAKLEVNVNGQKVSNGRGLKRVVEKKNGCPANAISCSEHNIDVNLDEGRNIIGIAAKYNGVSIDGQTIIINRKKSAPTANNRKPSNALWFFGVGVSEYENQDYNLQYAHADAKAIAESLKKQEGKLYSKVNTKVILNQDVSEKKVKIEMNRFLRQASSEDTIIIFTAGHGTRDSDGALYFMTHDSVLEEPYTGMNVTFFKDFLHGRPLNQKAMFWMDICHAGAIGSEWGRSRGRISSDDAIRLLSEGTGVAVMASSTGMESSLEGGKYNNHGAFTSAILEALNGSSEADMDNNGIVTVMEFQSYVSSRVPKITGGRQHPTSPSQVRLRDFPIILH